MSYVSLFLLYRLRFTCFLFSIDSYLILNCFQQRNYIAIVLSFVSLVGYFIVRRFFFFVFISIIGGLRKKGLLFRGWWWGYPTPKTGTYVPPPGAAQITPKTDTPGRLEHTPPLTIRITPGAGRAAHMPKTAPKLPRKRVLPLCLYTIPTNGRLPGRAARRRCYPPGIVRTCDKNFTKIMKKVWKNTWKVKSNMLYYPMESEKRPAFPGSTARRSKPQPHKTTRPDIIVNITI